MTEETDPRKEQPDETIDREPETEAEVIKDLDVQETDAGGARGGQSYGASAPTHAQ